MSETPKIIARMAQAAAHGNLNRREAMAWFDANYIADALVQAQGNQGDAARIAGLGRGSLLRILQAGAGKLTRRCLTITEDVTGAYRVEAIGLRGRFASTSYAAADPVDVLALVSVLLGLDDEEVLAARIRATDLAATMRAAAGMDT